MNPVSLQIGIWGHAVVGMGDVSTRAAESPRDEIPDWDEPRLLNHVWLNGKRLPEYHACYWLGEHIRRGHEVLPGQ